MIASALELEIAEYIDMSGKLLTLTNKPLVTCETVSQKFKLGIETRLIRGVYVLGKTRLN